MGQVLLRGTSTEGTRLPRLVKTPTTQQLVMFACATYDYYELHYDRQYALESGVDDVIVHGPSEELLPGPARDRLDGRGGHPEEAERPVQGHGHAWLASLCGGNGYTEVCPLRRETSSSAISGSSNARRGDHDARQRGRGAPFQTIEITDCPYCWSPPG